MKTKLLAILMMTSLTHPAWAQASEAQVLSLKVASAKLVIRKISGIDGKTTEVCRKTISVPIFEISNNMPMSPLPFVPLKCEAMMGEEAVTVTVTPSILEGNIPADTKDLMLADLGGGFVKYFGGILTVEPSTTKWMSSPEKLLSKNASLILQAPVMNGSGVLGSAPAKVFVTLAPSPNFCNSDDRTICKAADQFTATLLMEEKQ